jgi:ABC-type branched-subunit amino acid transport system substrate-binding protein
MRAHARAAAIVGCAAVAAGAAQAALAASATVVVPRGAAVHIVYVEDAATLPDFSASFANAIRMAVEARPTVRGFPIEVDVVEARCGDPAAAAAAATGIVADSRNVAVVGHICSSGFAQALPVYEAAGMVVVSGSATNDALPAFAPTVFDRTVVAEGAGEVDWYARVRSFPSDLAWQQAYATEFGLDPLPFADLYYDAATLLIRSLQSASSLDGGRWLLVDRAALAHAVRSTVRFQGVSCRITLDPATGNRLADPAALEVCAAGSTAMR